jgi:FkbM family methyltransferase
LLLSRWWYYLSSIPTLLLGVKNWPRMVAAFLGLPGSTPLVVELRNGYRFKVRTPMDIWIIKEICLDHQYEQASVEIQDGWTVLDIGAGLGDFAVHIAKSRPHCTVYAYEPFPQSFALLQENLRLNGVQNVQAFPYAISAQSGPVCFHITAEAVAHTTAGPESSPDHTIPQEGARSTCQVPAVTLDQVLAELHLSQCDYLKMDCEGAEYDILFNSSPQTLQQIRHLCLEYHDNFPNVSHNDLVRFFMEGGCEVRVTPCPAWRHLGLLYARRVDRADHE